MTDKELMAVCEFMNEMIMVRDKLKPILDGQIERGHCLAGSAVAYGGNPGKRKTMLKDAREIAKHCIVMIDREVNKLREAT